MNITISIYYNVYYVIASDMPQPPVTSDESSMWNS